MPTELAIGQDLYDGLGTVALHLIEQLATLNRTLSNIEECLRGIEQRLSYATALDNQD
jgi:hypothetical protein